MNLVDDLKWRYATKKMNGISVEESKINEILEATRYSASSFGLQPYHILVVKDAEVRKKLQPHAYNQSQIVDCSHLLVFCIWDGINQEKIDIYTKDIAHQREQPYESVKDFNSYISSSVLAMDKEKQNIWSAKQAYIALGTALVASAEAKVDSTPMEGFQPDQFDEVLGLNQKGLKSVVLLAIGYRDSEHDYLAGAKKVRRETNLLFERL